MKVSYYDKYLCFLFLPLVVVVITAAKEEVRGSGIRRRRSGMDGQIKQAQDFHVKPEVMYTLSKHLLYVLRNFSEFNCNDPD